MSDLITSPIVAAQAWKRNSDLIETAAALGYIGPRVLDPTYGLGNWWKTYTPIELVAHDWKTDGVDFRTLPDEGLFDTVAFDPPYIPQGGRATSTLNAEPGDTVTFIDRYGLRNGPSTNRDLRALISAGLASFTGVLVQRGTLLVKCMSYVNGSAFQPMPRWIANDAEALGYVQIDELVHLRRPGPQPLRTVQNTARRNYSLLLIFRWPHAPRERELDFSGGAS